MAEAASRAIDRMLALTKRLPSDEELRAEWTKFLTVAIAGHLERGIRDILKDFAKATGPERLARFVGRRLEGFRNPNPDRIVELIESFDADWAAQLKQYWGDGIKDSIRSLTNLRNVAAHSGTLVASDRDVRQYAEDAKRLLDFLATLAK